MLTRGQMDGYCAFYEEFANTIWFARKSWACKSILADSSQALVFFLCTPRSPKLLRLRPEVISESAQELRANWSCGQDGRRGEPPMKHVRRVAPAFGVAIQGLPEPASGRDYKSTKEIAPNRGRETLRAALRARADLIPDQNGETRSKSPATSSLKLVALSIRAGLRTRHFLSPKLNKTTTKPKG